MNNDQKKTLGYVVSGVGLIILIVGATTDLYPMMTGVLIALAVWMVGMLLLYLLKSGPKKEGAKPEAGSPEEPIAPGGGMEK